MAKLSQLLMLEGMLVTYDNMSVQDACVIRYQGMCIEGLVDDIITMLNRLLASKTRLSSRNVLLANFETMTDSNYWLRSKLFSDLPEDMGRMLKEKIEQMGEFLKALMLKIINVEADYADRFFEKVKTLYQKKKHTSDYELWKARQSRLTIERLAEYQAELTANMLIMGILKYDDVPSGREMEGVDMIKLRKYLKDGKMLPDYFEAECAKLRRYSHWEDDRFIIDYQLLRKYIFRTFGKMTSEQHIAIYEYDVQMKQIHEEMVRLKAMQRQRILPAQTERAEDEELFHFIHPSIDSPQEWQIHNEVKRLVTRQGIQEICGFLNQLPDDKKVLLPQNAETAYHELVRMRMPCGEGYNIKTFRNYYKR